MSSYYAADGQIARTPIPGGVEITAQEYKDALDGMLAGRVVQIVEGSLVVDFPPEPDPPEPEPTPEQILAAFQSAIEVHIEQMARSRDYSSSVSLASYVASTNSEWAAEAQAFVAWRDTVWGYAFQELAKVQAEERPQPTVEDFIAELPVIEWPEE